MLTIFTIPRAFSGPINLLQRNALKSWTMLQPACEIILCGDDPGVAEAAHEFGVRHIPDIARNEFGTPLLNSAFEQVVKTAKFPRLCYVNADIILLDDLLEAVQRIPFQHFMALGQRTNVDITETLNFEKAGWRADLMETVTKTGQLVDVNWIDCFVFTPDGQLEKLPAFAVGRPKWDNWFIFNARRLRVPVIDFTRVCKVIHQKHDYSHIPFTPGDPWNSPEGKINYDLFVKGTGDSGYLANIDDATYILTKKHLLPALGENYLRRRWYTSVALHPVLKPIADGLRPFFEFRRKIIDAVGKIFASR